MYYEYDVFGVTLSWIVTAAGPTKHRNPRKRDWFN